MTFNVVLFIKVKNSNILTVLVMRKLMYQLPNISLVEYYSALKMNGPGASGSCL